MRRVIVALAALLALVGCSVGPNYHRPAVDQPAAWREADSVTVTMPESTATALADTSWWELFGDTVLTDLVTTALRENYDARAAAARVDQLMALYGVTKSDFFPKFDAQAEGSRGQIAVPGDHGDRPTNDFFTVSLGATWELDLWGKIRRATEAARADLLAAEANRRGVALSIASLVASSYIDLLALDEQLDISRETARSRKHSLELMQQRFDHGDISEIELRVSESQYWLAMAQIPAVQDAITQTENALCVVLGRNPGPIPRGKRLADLALPDVPEGLQSGVLERRPDVQLAEEQLIAANARIGVAKSLYFPSISLTGMLGTASSELDNLFASSYGTWNAGGGLLQPIFHFGEIKGQVKASEAVQRQALNLYLSTLQSAFRDADDALNARRNVADREAALRHQLDAQRRYTSLVDMSYREGVATYLELLDAERSLFDTELLYASVQADRYKTIVGIYRAFGGGWVDRVAAESYPPEKTAEPRK